MTSVLVILLKIREFHTKQLIMAMTEDIRNVGKEKLALLIYIFFEFHLRDRKDLDSKPGLAIYLL